ncbi:MAG: hypothetical protein WCG27_12000, partial [Pseudomonadota bacterium]
IDPHEGKVVFLRPHDKALGILFHVPHPQIVVKQAGDLLVLHNLIPTSTEFNLPPGKWRVVIDSRNFLASTEGVGETIVVREGDTVKQKVSGHSSIWLWRVPN